MGRRNGDLFCYAEMGLKLNEEQNNSVEVSTENGTVEASNSAVDGGGQAIDYKAEYMKWKALSRKNEEAYKKASAELEKLRQASMSEAERAIEQARQEARNATLQEFGARLAEAEIRAAAASAGKKIPDGFSEFINLSKFVGDNGFPDADAISAFVNSLPSSAPANPFAQNVGIGPQGGAPRQLTREDLRRMTPEQIVEARKKGQLEALARGAI